MEHQALFNIYNGPDTNRTHLDCAKEWKKLGLGNIDALLTEQLIALQQRCKGEPAYITIIDIGCGTNAALLKSIIHDSTVALETRKYLSFHPNLSLELVALSDAETPDMFGKTVDKEVIEQDDMRAKFKHVKYTLSAAQTFKNFLVQENIENIQLALGTWSLSYLSPNVFKEVVSTSVEYLDYHGRFIGVGYNDSVSGIGFKYHADRDIVHFNIRSSNLPENFWEIMLVEFPENKNAELLRRRQIIDMKSYLVKVLNAAAVQRNIDYQVLLHVVQNATSAKELQIVANALKPVMRVLWEYQYNSVFKTMKSEILGDIAQFHTDLVLYTVSPNLFHLQKK